MPELPEVETARRYVHSNILHSKVVRVEVLDPRMLEDGSPMDLALKVQGREVQGTGRHGKNLFISFEDGTLHLHLGMSGGVLFCDDIDHHSSHERLRMSMDHGVLLLDDPRRFGRFGWVRSMDDLVARKGLGPDALSVSKEEFVKRLEGRKRAIKAILLDQRVIAGLGNLYVDEVLFQEGLCPTTPVFRVPPASLQGLWRRTREVLNVSIEAKTNFERLPPGYLLRQRRRGGTCPRCGKELSGTLVGGRTTIFCPNCQAAW